MPTFRINESIWTFLSLVLFQIVLLCAVLYVNDIKLNTKIIQKIPCNSSNLKHSNNNVVKLSEKFDGFLKRIQLISQEVWNYLVVYSQTINDSKSYESTKRMLSEISDMKNVVQLEAEKIQNNSLREWREKEALELSEWVQSHINDIQNPSIRQCISSQTIICNHTNGHGFASGFHDIVWCLVAAYYSNRTVILLSEQYHYLKEAKYKWNDFFMPLSNVCDESMVKNISKITPWPGSNNPVHRRLIPYLPKSIGKRITRFHSNPMVWWLAQFASYIMRPQPKLTKLLEEARIKFNFTHPIVGIHVRRTDKIGLEASYHNLSEYMIHVEDYYNKIELLRNSMERKVYLATDDPNVWKECAQNYPKYRFIGNQRATIFASKRKTRYNIDSFVNLIIDIYLLSETDYIVCTFSSGVCRVAFELMQKYFIDGGFKAQSIDVPFHYEYSYNPTRVAIYNHIPKDKDQWSLRIGDAMHVRNGEDFIGQAITGKKYDSYFYGLNDQKSDYLKYPAYKTMQRFPLY